MSIQLNGLTDSALLGLDRFVLSKALIWADNFYDSCQQTEDTGCTSPTVTKEIDISLLVVSTEKFQR